MGWIWEVLNATWEVFLLASPYILLGLAFAGALHVLVPADKVARWLGSPGFGSVIRAALLGIPLPLCSCAVVPVTIELSRKGASRESSLAFLVSTPETGVDSILLTWGLMGPIMAVARPIAALCTSLVAAATSRWTSTDAPSDNPHSADPSAPSDPQVVHTSQSNSVARDRLRSGVRYGFAEMVDEIGFWLVFGLLLTGIITALVPDDLFRGHLAQGPLALIALLLMGVPLYMCASASTPVAAALLLKGVSPGAALVFLLAGPATNASSLVVIARFFGRRFVSAYLISVVVVSLVLGLTLDFLVSRFDWSIQAILTHAGNDGPSVLHIGSAIVLLLLLAASLARGAWLASLRDLRRDLGQWRELVRG